MSNTENNLHVEDIEDAEDNIEDAEDTMDISQFMSGREPENEAPNDDIMEGSEDRPDPDIIAGINDIDAYLTSLAKEQSNDDGLETTTGGATKKVEPRAVYPTDKPMEIDSTITPGDMLTIIHAEIRRKGIAGHHIDSMNSFNKVGIKQIATKIFKIAHHIRNQRDKTDEDRDITDIDYKVDFTDIKLTPPTTVKYKSGSVQMLTPGMARIKNLTYSAQMFMSAQISATATYKNGNTKTISDELKDHRIASIPCETGTDLCNTRNCTKETLKEIEEDPLNPGGCFIIKGVEWNIDNLENITNNTFHVHKNMYGSEIVRGTILSKPGDAFENMYQVILRYLNSGAITLEITTNKHDKIEIPYYLIFRALGMTRDKDIIDNIVYGVENTDAVTKEMLKILEKSFEVEDVRFGQIRKSTSPTEIVQHIGQKITENANLSAARRDDNIMKYINNNILHIIDRFIFPHIGMTPAHRIRKMRFFGHLINKLLGVNLGVISPTDRDSYKNKRVFAAGTSMAKAFKTDFNFAIVMEIKKKLAKDFKTTPFSQMQLGESVKAAINSDDLERMLTQSITSGNKTITVKRNEVVNRVSSQMVEHKNDLAVKSALGTVNTPNTTASKQNERADLMRRVHPTYLGYIDVSQSPEGGEKVGLTKQISCTASVCGASSSFILKGILREDPALLDLDEVPPGRITSDKLAKVFVNGDWIGCCYRSHDLVRDYRERRRHGDIHYLTTVVWEPLVREVYFWTDVGRLMRPLMIVYNNIQDYIIEKRAGKSPKFSQWIKLTKSHIVGLQSRKISMEDLRKERVIEYISPEEQENILLSPNIDNLRDHSGDLRRMYTHCDIDQAIFGVVTLAAPMANHSNATRNTYYTGHRKASAGWFALNYPYRIDKNAMLQHYCERPLISTFSDSITYPNGQNTIVALAMHGGENQEDSIKANQSSIDCGAYNASYYNYDKTELEKGEQFGNPDYARTMDIKKDAVYEYVKDGFIAEGTRVQKGYVLIVKAAKIPKPDSQFLYSDKSIVYKKIEPAYIERVVTTRNDEDAMIAKVKWRSDRPLRVGDKLSCLTPDHDVLTERGWVPIAEVGLLHNIATLYGSALQFQNPTERHKYDVDGDIYVIDGKDICARATLEHRMYVSEDQDTYQLAHARDIVGRKMYYSNTAIVGCKLSRKIEQDARATGNQDVYELFGPAGTCRMNSTTDWNMDIIDNTLVVNGDEIEDRLEHYRGKVYCLTVPGEVFLVRHRGTVWWSGNSRTGNKGIVANIVPRCDMPYCEDGLVPDLIVNSHSIPTRMAVNQLTECLLGQVAARTGTHIDATSFRKHDFDGAIKILEENGIKYGGHRRMYNGMTGDWIDTLIFIGPTTYQRIKKFAMDEQYANVSGPTSALTRQPLVGKANDGGLRVGEMEQWVFSAHGTMRNLFEKFYTDSDGITLPICRICGNRAVVNEKMGIYKCKTCGDNADIVNVKSSWVANLFMNEASAMNVKMNFEISPHTYSRDQSD